MRLQVHSLKFDADKKLTDFIQKKTDKLHTFFDKITAGEVFMRLDTGEKADNKVIEIKLAVPGAILFAKQQASSFEAATERAVEALRTQLLKHKEKLAIH
jgi:putative sigma-54 modulation protein